VFELFGVLFIVMFIFSAIRIFKTSSRIGRFQNRIFDQIEKEMDRVDQQQDAAEDNRPRNYECDQCGATLGDNADVSPSGDFKCGYCNKWSNIHS